MRVSIRPISSSASSPSAASRAGSIPRPVPHGAGGHRHAGDVLRAGVPGKVAASRTPIPAINRLARRLRALQVPDLGAARQHP